MYGHDELPLKLTQTFRLVVAGSTLWLIGAIHNAFQVYENTDTRVQFMQKTVSVPLLIANTLFLVEDKYLVD